MYGTRLRIRQAADTAGTGLTSGYNTVGYGAYDYGPVYYNCSDAQSVGFNAPYNPVTITVSNNYLYFTPDDVYGGYCGDNGGSEAIGIYQVPELLDIWNSYSNYQNAISDITINIATTAFSGTQLHNIQYSYKQPNRFIYYDTATTGVEAAYNGIIYTTKNKVMSNIETTTVTSPNVINKIDTLAVYKGLTNAVIEVAGTTLNENGQQSVLLDIIYSADPTSMLSIYGNGYNLQQTILFDYTEGIPRQILSQSNGATTQTINYNYALYNGIVVPTAKYVIDSAGNTTLTETYNVSEVNQGLQDSMFVISQ